MTQLSRSMFAGGMRPLRATSRPAVRARYDNAQNTDDNQRNWWMSDYLSAKSANNFQVRRQLRNRSRYEVSNNPYLFGVCNNNADDLISTGPTLQVTTPNAAYNRQVESAWKEWAAEVNLVEKLRTLKLARTVDGEGFLILKTVEDLENSVKLYPCDVEADQVTSPAPRNLAELWVDGLVLHPVTGRPTAYHVLRHHPGDYFFPDFNPLRVDVIRARHVIHWFPKFRPGQVRGVPVFTPALDLFTELRSFRKAVLAKANVAANLSAVLESEAPADADGTQTSSPFDAVPIDRGMQVVLPHGMKMHQFEATEPSTTYEMFQEKCLGEACRPLSYPLNLALGTSQKFNFSSAKLDHINYREGLKVERADCETVALNRLFAAWFDEAVMVPGLLPAGATLEGTPREWHWPGFPTLDSTADTAADISQINAGTLNWRQFWAQRGFDWRDVMKQQAAEQAEIEALGLTFGEPLRKTERIDDGEPNDAGKGKGAKPQKKSDKVKAAFNEGDHPRDEGGRFGEGGAAGGDKDEDKVEKERDDEDGRVEKEREKEEDEWDERSSEEDRRVERQREKEDGRVERQREKEDTAFSNRLDRLTEKSIEKLEEKQDESEESRAVNEAIDNAETKEEREAAWEKADELTRRHAAEQQKLRDNEAAILEEREAKEEANRGKEDAERKAKREAEDEERDARHAKERDVMYERWAAEDEARDAKRAAEDEAREKARKAEAANAE